MLIFDAMTLEDGRKPADLGQETEGAEGIEPEGSAYNPTDGELRRDMAAILNAFDLSSPEEQERMLRDIGETGDTLLPPEQATKGMQAANLSQSMGIDRAQGLRHLDSLEDAAQHIPGIKGLLGFLGNSLPIPDKGPEEPR